MRPAQKGNCESFFHSCVAERNGDDFLLRARPATTPQVARLSSDCRSVYPDHGSALAFARALRRVQPWRNSSHVVAGASDGCSCSADVSQWIGASRNASPAFSCCACGLYHWNGLRWSNSVAAPRTLTRHHVDGAQIRHYADRHRGFTPAARHSADHHRHGHPYRGSRRNLWDVFLEARPNSQRSRDRSGNRDIFARHRNRQPHPPIRASSSRLFVGDGCRRGVYIDPGRIVIIFAALSATSKKKHPLETSQLLERAQCCYLIVPFNAEGKKAPPFPADPPPYTILSTCVALRA